MELYKPSNTNFDKNGDVKLQASNANLKVELNGICEIEFEHSYDKEKRWQKIENLGVVKCDVCYNKNQQLFRIYDISKNMFGVRVKARHIYFDLIDKHIVDTRAVNFNCETALNIVLTGTEFKGHSDIELTNTAYFVKMNALSAISGDSDNTILNRWGGEVIADNFDVYVKHKIGGNYGVKVKYSRNMLDIDLSENTDEIATRIYPQAYNGIMLPEIYIDSPLIKKYPKIKERPMVFEDLKLKEDCSGEDEEGFETKDALYEVMRQRVKEAFENGLDKPKLSGNVEIAILENTEEYKDYKNLVNVGIGDILTVEHKNIGVDITTRCVGFEWDILNKKYNSITLGELNTDYFDKQDIAKDRLDNILNGNGSVKAESLNGIVSALNTKFQALRDVAQPQEVRAMLFEDKVPGSKTYGALALGSMGLMIANKRTLDDKDWHWNTFIEGGLVYADWLIGKLKTVLIENLDASLQIDLTGSDGALFRNNGKDAIRIHNNSIDLYNWLKNGDFIGALMALTKVESDGTSNPDKPMIALVNDLDSALSLSYKDIKNIKNFISYVDFDKYNILKDEIGKPIRIYEEIDCKGNSIYNGVIRSFNKKNYINVTDDKISISAGNGKYIVISENDISVGQRDVSIVLRDGKWTINGPVHFTGEVTGLPTGGMGGGEDDGWENGTLSAKGFRFIKGFEGFAPSRYQDSGGYWTIAYGVTLHGEPSIYNQLVSESPISEERGAKVSYDLKNKNYGARIIESVKRLGCTTQYQFDALCSLAYNCGTGVVTRSNRLTNAIAQNPKNESVIRPIWESFYVTSSGIPLQGLRDRRREECNMFFNKPFEVREITKIPYSLGTVKENNGNGWLPEDNNNNNSNTHGHKSFDNAFGKGWLCPVTGGVVTSVYGGRDNPTGSGQQFHKGTDIGAPMGTDYLASKDGTVTAQGWSNSMGNYIYIDHPGGYRTRVMHLSKILTHQGQTIKRGDLIGKVGSTGDSTGPHCHWEIRRLLDNQSTDPAPTLNIGDRV